MKYLSYCVSQIPLQYRAAEDLLDCFHSDVKQHVRIKSVYPAETLGFDDDITYTATIDFHGEGEPRFDPSREECGILIDRNFEGFTPLFVPSGKVTADIIAVTGLGGHAVGSWANKRSEVWLRDYLPKDLRSEARVLTYGYPSVVRDSHSNSNIKDYADRFWQDLMDVRSHPLTQDRPLIFIGHSLGGIIIKHALAYLEKDVLDRLPVRAILFFGTPHAGLNVAALQTVVKGQPNENLVRDLDQSSQTLAMLSSRFGVIAPRLRIYSFFETHQTPVVELVDGELRKTGALATMVHRNSAVLNIPTEDQRPIPADHRMLVRLSKNEGSDYRYVARILREALQTAEQKYEGLRQKKPVVIGSDEQESYEGEAATAPAPTSSPHPSEITSERWDGLGNESFAPYGRASPSVMSVMSVPETKTQPAEKYTQQQQQQQQQQQKKRAPRHAASSFNIKQSKTWAAPTATSSTPEPYSSSLRSIASSGNLLSGSSSVMTKPDSRSESRLTDVSSLVPPESLPDFANLYVSDRAKEKSSSALNRVQMTPPPVDRPEPETKKKGKTPAKGLGYCGIDGCSCGKLPACGKAYCKCDYSKKSPAAKSEPEPTTLGLLEELSTISSSSSSSDDGFDAMIAPLKELDAEKKKDGDKEEDKGGKTEKKEQGQAAEPEKRPGYCGVDGCACGKLPACGKPYCRCGLTKSQAQARDRLTKQRAANNIYEHSHSIQLRRNKPPSGCFEDIRHVLRFVGIPYEEADNAEPDPQFMAFRCRDEAHGHTFVMLATVDKPDFASVELCSDSQTMIYDLLSIFERQLMHLLTGTRFVRVFARDDISRGSSIAVCLRLLSEMGVQHKEHANTTSQRVHRCLAKEKHVFKKNEKCLFDFNLTLLPRDSSAMEIGFTWVQGEMELFESCMESFFYYLKESKGL